GPRRRLAGPCASSKQRWDDPMNVNPPLSYSLPAWTSDGYDMHKTWLDDLKSLGFSWVTFTPTYLVYDRAPMRIDVSRGPAFPQLAEAMRYAVDSGFHVRLEPHLD